MLSQSPLGAKHRNISFSKCFQSSMVRAFQQQNTFLSKQASLFLGTSVSSTSLTQQMNLQSLPSHTYIYTIIVGLSENWNENHLSSPKNFSHAILIPQPLTEKGFEGFGCLAWLKFLLLAKWPGSFPSSSLHRGLPLFLLLGQFSYRSFSDRKAIALIRVNNLHLLAYRQHFFQVFTLGSVTPFFPSDLQ